MPRSPLARVFGVLVGAVLLSGMLLVTPAWAASTYWVATNSAHCDDAGPGTGTQPFCHIQVAATVAQAGDHVRVRAGVYREEIQPVATGTSSARLVFKASRGVVVLGTRDVSDPATWSLFSGWAWETPYSPTARQVFVDGARIAQGAAPDMLAPGEFFDDTAAGILYVNIGGGNPAAGHHVEAGALSHGFNVHGSSYLTISGFEFAGQNYDGIQVLDSSNVTITRDTVTDTGSYGIFVSGSSASKVTRNEILRAGSHGIKLQASTGCTVARNDSSSNLFHGIQLYGSDGNVVSSNVVANNSHPPFRVATGIDVDGGSDGNSIFANEAFGNQDSGIQVYAGSTGNLVVRNASWGNGDHGFDTNASPGTTYVSNTSYGNHTDGFSLEGDSHHGTMADNITADNGEFDVYVANDGSQNGFSSDYDVVRNSDATVVPVRFDGTSFPDVASFASATGNESHGISSDPMLADPVQGNLELIPGSPAIDSANAAAPGFSMRDLLGRKPVNDTATPDTGAGKLRYADRGALEYQP
jgi:parallel beta-helix repeat protein